MTDNRSERLRQRRNRSTSRTGLEESEPTAAEPTDTDSVNESGTPAANGDGDEASDSVKERQTGTYMYLPDAQVKDLRRSYNVLKAEYEYEFDDTFEKNRHFYPLVVQHGLDSLESMDAKDVRERLEQLS